MSSPSEEQLSVAVFGAAGYIGGELLRLLSTHPGVGSIHAYSRSHANQPWSTCHPNFTHGPPAQFKAPSWEEARSIADVVFLALPHGESQAHVPKLLSGSGRHPLVVDLGADFRIRDLHRYEAHYGPHQCPELVSQFSYGLMDPGSDVLTQSGSIAAPGCFATACLLGLAPWAKGGLISAPAVCFAVTGSSGSGATAKPGTHHPHRANNVTAYGLSGHRHEAEIGDQLHRWGCPSEVSLLTHSGPFVRGIYATLHISLTQPIPHPNAVLGESYAGRPFVRVLDAPPDLTPVVGTNYAHLHAVPRAGGGEVVVTVAIDNLTKGSAGQAIQAMNVRLGLPETQGLTFGGLSPC